MFYWFFFENENFLTYKFGKFIKFINLRIVNHIFGDRSEKKTTIATDRKNEWNVECGNDSFHYTKCREKITIFVNQPKNHQMHLPLLYNLKE